MKKLQKEQYQICWICPLLIERTAAEAMLDERHASLPKDINDPNIYTLGRMGVHNIAIAGMPAGNPIATNTAAIHMKNAFPAMRVVLLVGIGGGVPSQGNDIRLGDIVVSYPEGSYGGVVQVDRGKTVPKSRQEDGFEMKGALNQPPDELLNLVMALGTRHQQLGDRERPEFVEYLEIAVRKTPRVSAGYPGVREDRLFRSSYDHVSDRPTCDDCDVAQVILRPPQPLRENNEPQIHRGLIASANNVRKDAETRDKLRDKLKILCFEMESAGIMNNFPCLVIRGISDYADSHKNDRWQPHAAFVAAAYAKEALTLLPVLHVASLRTLSEHDRNQLTQTPYVEYVRCQISGTTHTAAERIAQVSQRSDNLKLELRVASLTTASALADIIWMPALLFIISLSGLIIGGTALWTFRQKMQHSLREVQSSSEELKSELATAVFWNQRGVKTIDASRGYDNCPNCPCSSQEDRRKYRSSIAALERELLELVVVTTRLKHELEEQRLAQARIENRIHELDDMENTEYNSWIEKFRRFWNWLITLVW